MSLNTKPPPRNLNGAGLNRPPPQSTTATTTQPRIIVHPAANDDPRQPPQPIAVASDASTHQQYAQPSHLSALQPRAELQRIRRAQPTATRHLNELTDVARTFVRQQATRQALNFRSERTVYRQLQPINVNDSVLELNAAATRKPRKPQRPFADRDPEPVLADYLRPVAAVRDRYAERYAAEEARPKFGALAEADYEAGVTQAYHVNYEAVCEVFDRLNSV